MKTIGITGGVGAGKSQILQYISEKYNCLIVTADKLAYELECPGQSCYKPIVDLLGRECLLEDGYINKNYMASRIFNDDMLLQKVNSIIHPAVKEYILKLIAAERKRGYYDFLFVEAALLIEDGYVNIMDELWYIYASPEVRRLRLKKSRGYTDAKIDAIFASQLKDSDYLNTCNIVIDNSGLLVDSYKQIDKALADS